MTLKVVELPRLTPEAETEVKRILGDLTKALLEDKLSGLAVVYFNPLGGWRIDATDNLTLSQVSIAALAMQQAAIEVMRSCPSVEWPEKPA